MTRPMHSWRRSSKQASISIGRGGSAFSSGAMEVEMVPRLSGQNARRGMLLVMIEIDPAHEQEFTEWYNKEHLPEPVNCSGFLSGRRFDAIEGTPKHLATYDLASTARHESPACPPHAP